MMVLSGSTSNVMVFKPKTVTKICMIVYGGTLIRLKQTYIYVVDSKWALGSLTLGWPHSFMNDRSWMRSRGPVAVEIFARLKKGRATEWESHSVVLKIVADGKSRRRDAFVFFKQRLGELAR